jgi:hypothetical protein
MASKLTRHPSPLPGASGMTRRVDMRLWATDPWAIQCPECFPLPAAVGDHAPALADPDHHLADEPGH